MQSKWITGQQVVEQLDIQPFELAELLRQEKLHGYSKSGRKFIAFDSFPLVEWDDVVDAFRQKGWTDEDFLQRYGTPLYNIWRKENKRVLPTDIANDSNIKIMKTLSLPRDEEKRDRVLQLILNMLFKTEDVEKLKSNKLDEAQQSQGGILCKESEAPVAIPKSLELEDNAASALCAPLEFIEDEATPDDILDRIESYRQQNPAMGKAATNALAFLEHRLQGMKTTEAYKITYGEKSARDHQGVLNSASRSLSHACDLLHLDKTSVKKLLT